jgi:hypothetical protein
VALRRAARLTKHVIEWKQNRKIIRLSSLADMQGRKGRRGGGQRDRVQVEDCRDVGKEGSMHNRQGLVGWERRREEERDGQQAKA